MLNEGSKFTKKFNFSASGGSGIVVLGGESVAHIRSEVKEVLVSDSLASSGIDDIVLLGHASLHGSDVSVQLALTVLKKSDNLLNSFLSLTEFSD